MPARTHNQEDEMPTTVDRLMVDYMLKYAYSAAELHAAIEAAVEWIEAHPAAIGFNRFPAS